MEAVGSTHGCIFADPGFRRRSGRCSLKSHQSRCQVGWRDHTLPHHDRWQSAKPSGKYALMSQQPRFTSQRIRPSAASLPYFLHSTLTFTFIATGPLPRLIQPDPTVLQLFEHSLTPPSHEVSGCIDVLISGIKSGILLDSGNQEPIDYRPTSIFGPYQLVLLIIMKLCCGTYFSIGCVWWWLEDLIVEVKLQRSWGRHGTNFQCLCWAESLVKVVCSEKECWSLFMNWSVRMLFFGWRVVSARNLTEASCCNLCSNLCLRPHHNGEYYLDKTSTVLLLLKIDDSWQMFHTTSG